MQRLTSKERATLRGVANTTDTIFQIGKGGIEQNLVVQLKDALKARELIKIKVLETCELSAKEAAEQAATATGAAVVQVIGGKFVLFLQNPKETKFSL